MPGQQLRRELFNHDRKNFFLLAGPCVVESRSLVLEVASEIKRITDDLQIPYVFKASYKKANRSSLESFTGIGDREALDLLAEVKEKVGVPVMTDVHSTE